MSILLYNLYIMNNNLIEAETIWEKIKTKLSRSNKISMTDYQIYFDSDSIKPSNLKDGVLYLSVVNKSRIDKIYNDYFDIISEILLKEYPSMRSIRFIDSEKKQKEDKQSKQKKQEKNEKNIEYKIEEKDDHSNINPLFTFDSLVKSDFNRLVVSAAQGIAKNDKSTNHVNFLFIYGSSGLGKTHILHSIANYLIENRPKVKFTCITTEEYTNEYSNALNSNETNNMIEKYRNLDYLLIDDIQFLNKKLNTQESLFNNINTLYTKGKKIIMCSDTEPTKLNFNERLTSRMTSGLVFCIEKPSAEERYTILNKKVQERNFVVSDKIIRYLADNYNKNIRELEGMLNSIYYYCQLSNIKCDSVSIAEEAISKSLNFKFSKNSDSNSDTLNTDQMIESICKYFKISIDDIMSTNRSNKVSIPRQLAMYFASRYFSLTNSKISEIFQRDHTTVMHAIKKITTKVQSNDQTITEHIRNVKDILKIN